MTELFDCRSFVHPSSARPPYNKQKREKQTTKRDISTTRHQVLFCIMSGIGGPLTFQTKQSAQGPYAGVSTAEGGTAYAPTQVTSTQVIVGFTWAGTSYNGPAGYSGLYDVTYADIRDINDPSKYKTEGGSSCTHWNGDGIKMGYRPNTGVTGYALTRIQLGRTHVGEHKVYRITCDWSFIRDNSTPLAGASGPTPVRQDDVAYGGNGDFTDMFGEPQAKKHSSIFIQQINYGWSCTSHSSGWIRNRGFGGVISVKQVDLSPFINLLNQAANDGSTLAAGCCQKNYTEAQQGMDVAVCQALQLHDVHAQVIKPNCQTCQRVYCQGGKLEEDGCYSFCNASGDNVCDAPLTNYCGQLYKSNPAAALQSKVCPNFLPAPLYVSLANQMAEQLKLKPGAIPPNPACVFPPAAFATTLKPKGYQGCQLNVQSCTQEISLDLDGATVTGSVNVNTNINCSQQIGSAADQQPAPTPAPAPIPVPVPVPAPAPAPIPAPAPVAAAIATTDPKSTTDDVAGTKFAVPSWVWMAGGGVLFLIVIGLVLLMMRHKKTQVTTTHSKKKTKSLVKSKGQGKGPAASIKTSTHREAALRPPPFKAAIQQTHSSQPSSPAPLPHIQLPLVRLHDATQHPIVHMPIATQSHSPTTTHPRK